MKQPKKKRLPKDDEMDDHRQVTISDLASFTSSDVIEELKIGLSELGPLEDDSHGRRSY